MSPLAWKVPLALLCALSPALSAQEGQFLTHDREVAEGVADNVPLVDPAADGWRSEVLHSAAKRGLKDLLGWAVRGKELSDGTLADGFWCERLRPEDLESIYADDTLTILSAHPHGGDRFTKETLAEAVAGLRGVMGNGEIFNDFFKYISVEVIDEKNFRTQFIIHLNARDRPLVTQVNIEGMISWVVGADDEHVSMSSLEVHHYEEILTATEVFSDITEHVFGGTPRWKPQMLHGVDQYMGRHDRLFGRSYIGSQGFAIGDIDGDGLDDIFVAQQGGMPNRLYRHLPGGKVEEVSARAQLDLLENTRGALLLDFDNDGDQDIAFSINSNIVVAYNDGTGIFGRRSVLRNTEPTDIYSMTAADADGDGDLDLYAARYIDGGLMGGVPTPYHDADNGSPNIYWRNDGPGEWTDATESSGLNQNNRKFSLGAMWDDLDGDGDMDLYVANDFGRNNLYVNDGKGNFVDEGIARGADDIGAAMGVSVADANLDGNMDILITNMFSSAGRRIATQSDRFMEGNDVDVHKEYVRHARGNSLLYGTESGDFEDVTEKTGVAVGGWAWGAKFVDFNNDGFDDIYSPNGFITSENSKDL